MGVCSCPSLLTVDEVLYEGFHQGGVQYFQPDIQVWGKQKSMLSCSESKSTGVKTQGS